MTLDESYNNYLSHKWETVWAGDGEADCYCVECGCQDQGSPDEFEWLQYPPCETNED